MFCRLLRYCLGEDRFAPQNQRENIQLAFKDGFVGAEVMLDGTPWAIVRPIGMRRRHIAIPNGDLDTLLTEEGNATGMDPFLDAVEEKLLTSEVVDLIPGTRSRRGWTTALAWLTRDQECRFGHLLEWRAASSDSDSPVRDLSKAETLDALRALIRAIIPEEHNLRAEINRLDNDKNRLDREIDRRHWEIKQTRTRLIRALGLEDANLHKGGLFFEQLRKAAQTALANAAEVKADTEIDITDLDKLKKDRDKAQGEYHGQRDQLVQVDADIGLSNRLIARIKGEIPSSSYNKNEAENPVCPVCEVPIDHALAEGCKLSHKLPDLQQIKKRHEKREDELKEEEEKLREHKTKKKEIESKLKSAKEHFERLRDQVVALEKARNAREQVWYNARRVIDQIEHLENITKDEEETAKKLKRLTKDIDKKREQVAEYRDQQASVFQRVTLLYDAIIRELVGPEAKGNVKLTGSGLDLSVELGGDRSTVAIDSLKVLAFDFAVLCMSIEGATQIPAFLLHDSPREADLGLAAYYPVFEVARSFEELSPEPLFQYIITTTTKPPDDLRQDPWLVLELHGAPAEERLMKRDL